MIKKVLFLTPPLKAWDSHGNHKACNQMHAQLASYLREKKLAQVDALDSRALELDWDGMLDYVKKSNPDMVFVGELLHSTCGACLSDPLYQMSTGAAAVPLAQGFSMTSISRSMP